MASCFRNPQNTILAFVFITLLVSECVQGQDDGGVAGVIGCDYRRVYRSPGSEPITVEPGTHKFCIGGVTCPCCSGCKHTEWYVNGGTPRETDNSCFLTGCIDPSFDWSFAPGTTGTTVVEAVIYDRDWNYEETHRWNVTVGQADLIVHSVIDVQSNYCSGDTIHVKTTIKNIGNATAPSSHIKYWLGKGSNRTYRYMEEEADIKSLSPQDTDTDCRGPGFICTGWQLPSDLPEDDDYRVWIQADSRNEVPESDESIASNWGSSGLVSIIKSPNINAIGNDSDTCGTSYTGPTPSLSQGLDPDWSLEEGPPGMTINNSGRVSWSSTTPGNHFIEIKAENDCGSDTESWTLTVNRLSPVINNISDQKIQCCSSYTGPTPSVTNPSCMNPITWSKVTVPSGVDINTSTGVVTWPNPVPGTHTITIRATNSSGSDDETWTLTVNGNQPPTLIEGGLSVAPSLVMAGNTVTANFTINNPNPNTLKVCRGFSIHLGNNDFVDIAPWRDPTANGNPIIDAQPGTHTYPIQYTIPSDAYAGPYTVRYRLWPVTNNLCDYSGDDYDLVDKKDDLHIRRETVGVTVITHGFQFFGTKSGWVQKMAEAIIRRAGHGTVLRYNPDNGRWDYVTGSSRSTEELVLIFNWADESNAPNFGGPIGTGEGAGDALYAALLNPIAPNSSLSNAIKQAVSEGQIHLIGHSRGAVVNSEVVQRLSLMDASVSVAHVTTLDPHPVDGSWGIGDPDWKDPKPVTWTTVEWADNYWRSDGLPKLWDFDGMPVVGACNKPLDSALKGFVDACLEHSAVHDWYLGTIDLYATGGFALLCGGQFVAIDRNDWYQSRGHFEGFFLSKMVGSYPILPEICPDLSMNHGGNKISPDDFSNQIVGADPREYIYNGQFQLGTDQFAGWMYHGGDVDGRVVGIPRAWAEESGNVFGRIGDLPTIPNRKWIRHNRLYIDQSTTGLGFSYRVHNSSSNDTFSIIADPVDGLPVTLLGPEILGSKTGWQSRAVSIPTSLRGKQCTIEFRVDQGGSFYEGTVDIDNIRLVTCALPSIPANVVASDGTSCLSVHVTWIPDPSADCYEIWRSQTNDPATGEWLADDCGSPFGDTTAEPGKTYYYWVKGKNSCGTSSFSNSDSGFRAELPPAPTNAFADDSTICAGDCTNINASVPGMEILWYENDCNGDWFDSGNSVPVCPTTTTTYYARSRSIDGCVSTDCDQVIITVLPNPSPPTKIYATINPVCVGEATQLCANVPAGHTIEWYANDCEGSSLGAGSCITVNPQELTTYYALAVSPAPNGCESETCASITVNTETCKYTFIADNGNWSEGSNWSSGLVPTSDIDVNIPAGKKANINASEVPAVAANITIETGGAMEVFSSIDKTPDLIAGKIVIEQGGYLGGNGVISGTVENYGTVSPGSSIGKLEIRGIYDQMDTGNLLIEIGNPVGEPEGFSDELYINGTSTIDGMLEVKLFNDYVPQPGESYDVFTAHAFKGAFEPQWRPPLPNMADVVFELVYDDETRAIVKTFDTADVNRTGTVNVDDLLRVIGAWGLCSDPCPEDINGDGIVDIQDVLIVIDKENWTFTE